MHTRCRLYHRLRRSPLRQMKTNMKVGDVYGELTVLELIPGRRSKVKDNVQRVDSSVRCKCSCGVEIISTRAVIKRGVRISCGHTIIPHGGKLRAAAADARGVPYCDCGSSRQLSSHRMCYACYNLWSRFRLTRKLKRQMLEEQGGRCKCCGTSRHRDINDWCVDHDHFEQSRPWTPRGIICESCNIHLGHIECYDKPQYLYDYLKLVGSKIFDKEFKCQRSTI
jgi:Recombination endonuclease VII